MSLALRCTDKWTNNRYSKNILSSTSASYIEKVKSMKMRNVTLLLHATKKEYPTVQELGELTIDLH